MDFTTLIDADRLRGLLGRTGAPRPVLLDCRFDLAAPGAGRLSYATAHIPGAHYVDLNLDLAAPVAAHSGRHPLPSAATLTRRLGSLGIGDDTQVIAYDEANGSFAARAWWLLRWLGHSRIAVLDGGFKAWVAAGGALEAAEPSPATGMASRGVAAGALRGVPKVEVEVEREVEVDAASVATAADVLRALQDPERRLVDARAAERFAGTVEPMDPVAGHIPGAVNHPFTRNLSADGCFLPAAELRRQWLERLAGAAPERTILMCGSGVTACHNALAMEVAGLPGARLYAGSWSEWIRDPMRPVDPPRPPA